MILGSNEQLQQELEHTLQKPDYHSWGISKMQSGREGTLEERYAIKFCFKLGKNASQKRMECFRLLLEYLAWIKHQFFSGIRDSRKAWSQWGMMRGMRGVRKSIHQSWWAKGLGLGLLSWGFNSYTKWPEVLRFKRPTTGVAITFLHELFALFGVVDCLVSDKGTQFTSSDFKEFCGTFQIKHITTPPYHPGSNGLPERFVDTLKRALLKFSGTPPEKALQQFLQVYRIKLNPNTPDATSPAETMFLKNCCQSKQLWVWPELFPQKDITQETKFASKPTLTTHLIGNWEQSTNEFETRHTSFWALPPHIKDTRTKSGGDGWITLAAHPKTRKKLSKRCMIRLISNLHKQP